MKKRKFLSRNKGIMNISLFLFTPRTLQLVISHRLTWLTPTSRYNSNSTPTARYNSNSTPTSRYNSNSTPTSRYNSNSTPTSRYNSNSTPTSRYNSNSTPTSRYNSNSNPFPFKSFFIHLLSHNLNSSISRFIHAISVEIKD